MNLKRTFVLALGLSAMALIVVPNAAAQAQQRQPTPNDTLQSPRVAADRKATISIYAPKASEVTVSGDFSPGKPLSLTKGESGVWSVTTGPLRPDYYTYTLMVDGVRTVDPKNPVIKQGIGSLENVMIVPGNENAFQENAEVPHGELRQVWYKSGTLSMLRRMHIYTPPGYEKSTTKYPVFYLLHGGGDDDSGWNSIGRAGFILDNLIAAGKAKPMIMVMPNGSMPASAFPAGTAQNDRMNKMADLFSAELTKEVMPYVEKTYRVLPGRENRAVAGLSMGGLQTLDVALSNPDLFNYVGVWSSGFFGPTIDAAETKYAKALKDPNFNKNKKLFLLQIGKDDFLMDASNKTKALLDKNQIRYQYKETEGGHTWINWRQYLNEYAQVLFK